MVNLRQRSAAPKIVKRTSARKTTDEFKNNYEGEIKIDSSASELSEIDVEDDKDPSPNLLDGYTSEDNHEDEDSFSILDSGGEEEEEVSEDDKEIQRIIEKTGEETRNIPLTARQRAKLDGGISELGEALETSTSAGLITTDEQALKNSEKSRRRKLQRDAKIEENKRATIDRLLQKQKKTPVTDSNSTSTADPTESTKSADNSITNESTLKPGYTRYIDKSDLTLLQFPDLATLQSSMADLNCKPPKIYADPSTCQVCKKYSSKYVHPLKGTLFCSSACYKLIQ